MEKDLFLAILMQIELVDVEKVFHYKANKCHILKEN